MCVDVPAAPHVCQRIASSQFHSSSLAVLHYLPGFALSRSSPGPDRTVLILSLCQSMQSGEKLLQQGELMELK